MFCLPVPKGGESFVTFLVQMQLPHVFFTLLEEFNRYHVRAQPHMVLTHYTARPSPSVTKDSPLCISATVPTL